MRQFLADQLLSLCRVLLRLAARIAPAPVRGTPAVRVVPVPVEVPSPAPPPPAPAAAEGARIIHHERPDRVEGFAAHEAAL